MVSESSGCEDGSGGSNGSLDHDGSIAICSPLVDFLVSSIVWVLEHVLVIDDLVEARLELADVSLLVELRLLVWISEQFEGSLSGGLVGEIWVWNSGEHHS